MAIKVKSDLHDGPSLDLTRLPSNAQGLVSYLHTLITLAGSSEQSRVLDEYKYFCIIYNLIILTGKCTQILFDVKYTLYIFLLSTVYSHDLGRPKCISMFCVCLPVLDVYTSHHTPTLIILAVLVKTIITNINPM